MVRPTQSSRGTVGAFNLSRLRSPRRKDDLKFRLLPCDPTGGRRKLTGFEAKKQANRELKRRQVSLELHQRRRKRCSKRWCEAHLVLDTLPVNLDASTQSFANPIFMRTFRRRFFGAVLRLLRTDSRGRAKIYTLVSAKWLLPASELAKLRPRKILEAVRSNLIKFGEIDKLSGWAICFVHNEYDPATDSYQPHIHAIVVGPKRHAFNKLRELEMFQGGKGKQVYRPIKAQGLKCLPRQVSYLFKGYWPARATAYLIKSSGKIPKRTGDRIPESRHAEAITFLHAQRFADLIWMHNVKIAGGEIVLLAT